MCVYASLPVCWLSRISSERTPVSFGCQRLKDRTHSQRCTVTTGHVRVLFCVEVQVICDLYHNTNLPTGKTELINEYTVKVHLSLTNKTHTLQRTTPGQKENYTLHHTCVSLYFWEAKCVCLYLKQYYLLTCAQMPLTTLKMQLNT